MTAKDFFRSVKAFYDKIYRFLLFFFSIGIIVYLFPTHGKFEYDFQKGRPWKHETLISPYDFPVYKSGQELAHERDSLLKDNKPYFRLDETVASKQYRLLEAAIESELKHLNGYQPLNNQQLAAKKYYSFLKQLIEPYFSSGIVEFTEVLEQAQTGFSLIIIRGTIAETKDISRVFTPLSAYSDFKKQLQKEISKYPDLDIQFINALHIDELFVPNLYFDKITSDRVKNEIISNILPHKGMIQSGERIIIKGDVVDESKYQILNSLKTEHELLLGTGSNYLWLLTGELILVISAILVLFLFLYHFRREILYSSLKTTFILIMVVLMVAIGSLTVRYNSVSLYLVPFAILPVIIRTFYDSRLALFIHIITIMLIGFQVPNAFEFVFMQFVAGIVAIMSLSAMHRRRNLFFTVIMVFISYAFVHLGLELLKHGHIDRIDYGALIWFAGNCFLITLCYPFIFVFEKIFGFLSDITLMELSDTNHPLLRELAEKAPGTFQHSITVAGMAQEATIKVGGNPLLVHTGALYHDIGKMFMPQFFIENQKPGENPHDKLEPEESAKIIISHIARGVEIARKHKLPQQLVDFIRSHHGTNKVEYFYRTFRMKYPNKPVDTETFTYPGPVPFSRETAVLMMADAVEAASRSLKSISEESLTKLVDDIISQKINDDQFMFTNITFKDITTVKDVFKKKLINIFHSRIEYPKEIAGNG